MLMSRNLITPYPKNMKYLMLLVAGIFASTLSYAQQAKETFFWIEPSLFMIGEY